MAFLEANQINVSYGKVKVLHEVSLKVNSGQIITVIGANGAGKTTLINTLAGVLRFSGSIFFDGKPLPQPASQVARAGIMEVPEGRKIFSNLTVEENLILGGYCLKEKKQLQTNIDKMYQLFPRLKERRRQYAGCLSGGEQQMLAISRGLMSNPRLLMLDEPSLGLAPKIVKEVFSLIKEVNAQGVTILLVEQNAHKALEIADLAYVLENGRIVAEGRGLELLEDTQVKEAYLGVKG